MEISEKISKIITIDCASYPIGKKKTYNLSSVTFTILKHSVLGKGYHTLGQEQTK